MNALSHNQEFAVVEPVRWCILRTSNQNTLPLAKSLAASGFTVWTPIEERTVRVPRANVKRRVSFPLMPSYVFALADRLPDLFALANDPTRQHRQFRVFQRQDRVPLIDDRDLTALRIEERKAKPKDGKPKFDAGEIVRIDGDDGFAGLTGTVESTRGEFVSVRLPGFHMVIKIKSFYLLRDSDGSGNKRAA